MEKNLVVSNFLLSHIMHMMLIFLKTIHGQNYMILTWEASPVSFNPDAAGWGVQWHSANRRPVCFSPQLGWWCLDTAHTHLLTFLIHCSEAELHARTARLLGQHAESGLQQQISLRRPKSIWAEVMLWCENQTDPCLQTLRRPKSDWGLVYSDAADSISEPCHS